jgi:gamma-glutamyltranspeptidase/glutathione hydrolase
MPVFARNMVAASQPLAAQAGLEILRQGGNAADAAIAVAITLSVVECTCNGIGGDAFVIIWDNKSQKLYGLNASGKSPKSWNFEYFAKKYKKMPFIGWDAVTVPGAVSGWLELSAKFGRLPFEALFQQAINYAKNGFHVSPITAKLWKRVIDKYKEFPDFINNFTFQGRTPEAGEKICFIDQANSLSEIGQTKTDSFYRGRLAEKIAAHAQSTGGFITKDDLLNHQAEWVEPISLHYKGFDVQEIPPNGQGIAALMMLGILSHLNIEKYPLDSADSIHMQIEAMKLAFADLYQYVSDPDYMNIDYHDLLNESYLSERAKCIHLDKAQNISYGVPREQGDTVYLTTADEEGMMVSFIQSNYTDFGSGIVVPGTGISLQSRGACFSLRKNHANQVEGGKRPFHTIIPAFVTQKGQPVMSFGVMGGAMQPQGQTQILVRMIDYHQNSQAASDAPRWCVLGGMEVAFEEGMNGEVVKNLENRGHEITIRDSSSFGGAQLIYKIDHGYCGASDHRKDGQAVGF